MKTLRNWRFVALAPIALGVAGLVAVACSDDGENVGVQIGNDAGKSDGSVTPGADTGPGDDGSTAQGKPPGCFAGTPVDSLDFLNACTTSDYALFNNCDRLGVCDGGALPPLVKPTVDAGVDSGTDSGAAADASDGSTDAATDGG